MSITSDMKWLVKKIKSNGSLTKKKFKRNPEIIVRVQRTELFKAIRILTNGLTSVTVTEELTCWKVSLSNIHAKYWSNLITPYLKASSSHKDKKIS
jgi:hypothetical protein